MRTKPPAHNAQGTLAHEEKGDETKALHKTSGKSQEWKNVMVRKEK